MLAISWHCHHPGAAQGYTCLALWFQPVDVYTPMQALTARAVAGLNSTEPDRKVTALHQQQSATDRTAGPQSLFLYFLLGLYTPALRASDMKPCWRCPVFYGFWPWTSPWCPLLPPPPPYQVGHMH